MGNNHLDKVSTWHGLPLPVLLCVLFELSALSFKNKNKNTQQKTNQKIKLLPWGRGWGGACVIKSHQYTKKRIFSPERVTVTLFYRMKIHHRTSEVPWMDAAWPAGPGSVSWLSSSRPAAVIIPDRPDPRLSRATTGQPHPSSPDQPPPANAYLPALVQEMPAVPCTQHVPRPGRGWCYNEALPGGSRRREQRGGCLSTPAPHHQTQLTPEQHRRSERHGVQLHTDFFF